MPEVLYIQTLLRHGSYRSTYNLSSLLHPLWKAGNQLLWSKMPFPVFSLRLVSKFVVTYLHMSLVPSGNSVYGGSPPTCSNPQLSCHNTAAVQDTCCFNSPGGELLQTQFWDTNPPTGPVNSWTIHGLWSVFTSSQSHRQFTCLGLITAMGPTMRTAMPTARIPTSLPSSQPLVRQLYLII